MKFPALSTALEACNLCAERCDSCALMILQVGFAERAELCFQHLMDCAFVCRAAADLLSNHSRFSARVYRSCARLCRLTAFECRKHAFFQYHDTAAACDACAHECDQVASGLGTHLPAPGPALRVRID